MTISAAYSRYPRAGDIAVLCEGDVAGFEVDLIEKLVAVVDVWPCGTQDSIFGLADAIGRSRPLVVVEDRDYRTREQASADCERKRQDRLKRLVAVDAWRTWDRNEIENYVIERSVVVPTLAHYFQCEENDVEERLESVVTSLRIDQAAQFALYQFRYSIPPKSRYMRGLPRSTARPRWSASVGTIVVPDRPTMHDALRRVLKETTDLYRRDGEKIDWEGCLEQFRTEMRRLE